MSSSLGLDAAAAALLGVSFTALDDDEVLGVVREVESARRRLAAVDHRLIAELDVRGVAGARLQKGTAGLLSAVLHLDRGETARRVKAALVLGPRVTTGGEVLDPVLPCTAAGQARGELSAEHARVVERTMGALPSMLDPELRERAEAQLAGLATHMLPAELVLAGERIRAHLDPDGSLTDDDDRERRRAFTIGKQGDDGMSPVRGVLNPQCRAVLDAAMTPLTRPAPTEDGAVSDPRTPAQRGHDALRSLARRAMAAATVGTSGGATTTVVISMGIEDLDARAGQATTATGATLPIADALNLAADACWILGVLDRRGQPLWLSRTQRLATGPQRKALFLRDGGCTRPGCSAPAAWCEAHHLISWLDGGPTDLPNLALVCSFDHHLITHDGYTVTMGEHGRITWTTPAWLDPTRTPRVNGT
ncbi:MAG: DUF222 domain-containing protein, partial [Mycobacteriaceae bacterium]